MSELPVPCVYAVSSRRRLAPEARTTSAELTALEEWLDAIVQAGVDAIQIRECDLGASRLATLVQRAVRVASGTSTKVFVNDRVDVAVAARASGVHLPSTGLPAAAVRRHAAGLAVGVSAHRADDAARCGTPDYAIFGTVYPSRSKGGGHQTAGVDGLAAWVAKSPWPVLAIGGLTPGRAAECRVRGAGGVAAIGAFLPVGLEPGALGPSEGVRAFRLAMASVTPEVQTPTSQRFPIQ